ncbi:transcriptional regulator [Thermosipho melanesiensis]|uniref:Condensin subunit ScpB n=2 Tax=Thermosipho melanesiensis TaxID=46541 RepID=A0ABN4UZ37_9BACT|nr:SMC-Scp complex subunit ScpB [Thermosipho melanesiensis]ABR31151.1 putative transcriptional regulator [Thermosipho melanesiensis BI429]APT74241.1 Condensin subunit ScpB [Thermosipho melanesiensis]OOC36182.1 transcriptional regulator [Thermosipho melanesiensis]OOC37000.1 transcriptional regulator [Thermosipho melanesiensis]OOC37752.1 transcriptional regulator [Thermosipho melanesiensis]
MDSEKVAIIESLIFASKGIQKEKILEIAQVSEKDFDDIVKILEQKYNLNNESGIELRNIDGFFKFFTKKKYAIYIEKIIKRRSLNTLTTSQLEIVILLASKKKATKRQIDEIRGKDSTNILKQLLMSGVVKRRKSGRSYIYSLTDTFKEETFIEELLDELGGVHFDTERSQNDIEKDNGKQ